MAEQITNYQCPACTGPLHFNGASGRLECEYCGNSYSTEEMEALYAEKEEQASKAFEKEEEQRQEQEENFWDTSSVNDDWGSDEENMRAYQCPSCGAELICDASTAAGSCPYCGNPTIVPGQFAGTLKPDYIIPFKLEKKAAV